MNDKSRSDKIALLFQEAVEIASTADRADFLARACVHAPDLRREVELLLHAHHRAGVFLRGDPRLQSGDSGPTLPEDFKPGELIGTYRLLGRIGEGASSTVYLAEQQQPVRRWVALKLIKPGMDTRQVISRFELERQALAVMDHPGIAKVLEAGAAPNGRPFFVMEWVRGTAITRHCDEHRLKLNERLALFTLVCQAVQHAHQKGIIHRDIKPENILVSLHDGRAFPKVIDFGIAKLLSQGELPGTPVTAGIPFLGTPAYMSPEQAQVTMPDLDTRTDIYSLGALLYELLSGHPPFDHQQLMAAGLEGMCHIIRCHEPLGPSVRFAHLPAQEKISVAAARNISPDELCRAIAGDLEWITLKALEKDRERRYQSAVTLVDDIQRHLHHLPVSAAAPTLRYRASKMLRRNRKAAITAAGFALLLLTATVATGVMALRARANARRAQTLQAVAMRAERQSHETMVGMYVASGLKAGEEGGFDRSLLWFAYAAQAAGPESPDYQTHLRRARAWLERTPVPVGAFQLGSAFHTLEFSTASAYLLALDRDGGCRVWDCVTRQSLPWPIPPALAAAWHPDGTRLALALKDREVQIRAVPSGKILHSLSTTEPVQAVAFTGDGQYLLFGGQTVRAFHVPSGCPVQQSWPHPNPVVGFGSSLAPDRAVTVCLDGNARVLCLTNPPNPILDNFSFAHRPSIRVDSCSSKTSYREDFLKVAALSLPALALDGTTLVTRTGPYDVSVWDLATQARVHHFKGMCCSCRFVLSPDGKLLAGAYQGGRVGIWDLLSGQQRAVLTSSGACILDIAFGPDSTSLITAEAHGVARLWSVPTARALHSNLHHLAEVDKVALSPNGRWAATAQADGLVRLWALPDDCKGYRIPSELAPKIVRMDPRRQYFAITREPAWKESIRSSTIFSASSGTPAGPTINFDGNLEDVALSPGGQHAALAYNVGAEDSAGVLQFWDVATGRITGQASLLSSAASLSWDPAAGRVAAICHSGQLFIAKPGTNPPAVWAHPPYSGTMRVHPLVAFTPLGQNLVSLTPNGTLEVRNGATGELRYPPFRTDPMGFWHFAVSHDGRCLAGTTRSGQVYLWDLHTAQRTTDPLAHPGWVYRCQFSPDATVLVTAAQDGRARLWDLRTGQPQGPALVHPAEVYDATFTPDGKWILTACRDGSIRLWDLQSRQLIAAPWKVGAQAFSIDVTADGAFAVAGSHDDAIHILSLDILQTPVIWESDEMCLLAEVVSGSILTQGKIRELTTVEWLQKEQQLRQLTPRRIQLKRSSIVPSL